jgi:hypothetical protein
MNASRALFGWLVRFRECSKQVGRQAPVPRDLLLRTLDLGLEVLSLHVEVVRELHATGGVRKILTLRQYLLKLAKCRIATLCGFALKKTDY